MLSVTGKGKNHEASSGPHDCPAALLHRGRSFASVISTFREFSKRGSVWIYVRTNARCRFKQSTNGRQWVKRLERFERLERSNAIDRFNGLNELESGLAVEPLFRCASHWPSAPCPLLPALCSLLSASCLLPFFPCRLIPIESHLARVISFKSLSHASARFSYSSIDRPFSGYQRSKLEVFTALP